MATTVEEIVICDRCNKWRHIAGFTVRKEDPWWECSMALTALLSGCNTPQDPKWIW